MSPLIGVQNGVVDRKSEGQQRGTVWDSVGEVITREGGYNYRGGLQERGLQLEGGDMVTR